MKRQTTVVILLLLLGLNLCQAEIKWRDKIELTSLWQIQPAQNPEQFPTQSWATTDTNAGWWLYRLQEKSIPWKKGFGKSHCRWYRQEVTIPANWQTRRILIDFSRLDSDAIVFLNGQRVGELLTPGGELDISKHVVYGEKNELLVFSTRDYTGISRGEKQDILRQLAREKLGIKVGFRPIGIAGPVTLSAIPANLALRDVFVITSWRDKTLTIDLEIDSVKSKKGIKAEVVVLDQKQQPILTFKTRPFHLTSGIQRHQISHKWENPIPWELDAPYLYTLKVSLLINNKITDSYSPLQFGFREIYTEGRNLMLNGHPCRWRVGRFAGMTSTALSYYRLLGYNVHHASSHPKSWWTGWWGYHDTPSPALNSLAVRCDETGTGLVTGVPTINWLREEILTNPEALKQYKREMAYYVRQYRNHPAILAWSVGMNAYNPRDGIYPTTFGQKKNKGPHKLQQQFIAKAIDLLKEIDPTRLVYSYADGNLGDINTSNTYMNLTPLQEREDWPKIWAEHGDMPAFPVEFGQPYDSNFWQQNRFLMTEYLARFYGDQAFEEETEQVLSKTVARGLKKSGLTEETLKDYPLYWNFLKNVVKNTDRSWRSWGMLAWHYWDFRGFGVPEGYWPEARDNHLKFGRYSKLKEPVTEMPSWANRNVDIYTPTMQPLLAYIAGIPVHTDKTHAFFSGSKVRKQIAWIWDGPGPKTVTATWQVVGPDNKVITSGNIPKTLTPGDIVFSPITFNAPRVTSRTNYRIELKVTEYNQILASDHFNVQVFPEFKPVSLNTKIAVMDPKGKTSSWLKRLGVNHDSLKIEANVDNYDLVIIGREALKPGVKFPVSSQQIKNGKKVIVFEQQLDVWEGLGFQVEDTFCRQIFVRDHSSLISTGLSNDDLEHWAGSPDLLPEFKTTRNHTFRRASRSSNRHTVASVMLRIPQTVGFTPVFVGEFDLNYSPLLVWNYGAGQINYCSLDLTGRIGISPAATHIAANLLKIADSQSPLPSPVCYFGGTNGRELLRKIQVKESDTDTNLLVIGKNVDYSKIQDIIGKVQNQTTLLFLPQDKDFLAKFGLLTESKTIYKTSLPKNWSPGHCIGPNLLRWRDGLKTTAFSKNQPAGVELYGDGLFASVHREKCTLLFSQISPWEQEQRYSDTKDLTIRKKRDNITLSIEHTYQLYAQLMTNLGARSSTALAKRQTSLKLGAQSKWVHSWNVLGPFYPAPKTNPMTTAFPGKKATIQGDFNPNILFKTGDGRQLDWRGTVSADPTGYTDLKKALNTGEKKAVTYLIHHLTAPKDYTAELRIGLNYHGKIWVNEKLVYSMTKYHGTAQRDHFRCRVQLKKGENTISAKIASGPLGYGLWLAVSSPDADLSPTDQKDESNTLYPSLDKSWDPYNYNYW